MTIDEQVKQIISNQFKGALLLVFTNNKVKLKRKKIK